MAMDKEGAIAFILIVLGAIVIPVLFIWANNNLLGLTLKTWVGAFFLLLLVRVVSRKRAGSRDSETGKEEDQHA